MLESGSVTVVLYAAPVLGSVAALQSADVPLQAAVPPFVTLALGSAYFRQERFADAEREYKLSVASDPKMGDAWNNLAVVYLMTSRYVDAESAVKAAEKAGYNVSPNLKDDIKRKKSGA